MDLLAEDDEDVWLKALEVVEQDASLGQPSIVGEVDSLVCDGAPCQGRGGRGTQEEGTGTTGSPESYCPAGRVNCKQVSTPPATDDLLLTEEEMRLFLSE